MVDASLLEYERDVEQNGETKTVRTKRTKHSSAIIVR
jgi:hypothetical protein